VRGIAVRGIDTCISVIWR